MHLLRAPGWRACLPLTLVLASCSGGSTSSTVAANAIPVPGVSKAAHVVPASLTFVIPRTSSSPAGKGRKPQYLPATTASVQITLVQVNGSAPSPTPSPTIVTVSGSTCTTSNANYTCTVPLGLPIGSDVLLVQAYDAANATGNMLSSQQRTFTIAAASTNNLSMTLDAKPGAITVTPPIGTTCSGSPLTCTITGAGAQSFTVSIADAHGTALTNNSIAGSPALSLASNSTAIATSGGATLSPYGISLTPVGNGTAGITVTAGPATGTSGLTATTFTFNVNVALPIVTTLAGNTTHGSNNATGTAASFYNPFAVAVDAVGNVYVADSTNNEIRMVTASGAVTTFAGSTTPGDADGNGTSASFTNPIGIAIDTAGDLYVVDNGGNAVIRKITPAGNVTTLAGAAAGFTNPFGVAVDTAGTVYVADTGNQRIQKITSGGVVSTLAGSGSQGSADGTGTAASFKYPVGVAVDSSNNVYVADSGNNKIRKVTSAGVVTTLAGTGVSGSTNGPGTSATFNDPEGVAVDTAGNVYVASTGNNKIRKITPAGYVSTLIGTGASGATNGVPVASAATFHSPQGIGFDTAGNLYVADTSNNEIRKITGITP